VRDTVATRVLDLPSPVSSSAVGELAAAPTVDEGPALAFATPNAHGARVLGTTFNRRSHGGVLAFTGADVLRLVLLALVALFFGWRLRWAAAASD
jgi:hypothetical protein